MNTTQFNIHFSLQTLTNHIVSPPKELRSRKAAVLVPLLEVDGELQLLLTKRALHLRAHPGQFSFPGGKVDKQDSSMIFTALREAEEEIALLPENVDVIGTFPPHTTFTGFEITPVIGIVKQPFEIALDPGEVAEAFWVPLKHFLNPKNRHSIQYQRHGSFYDVHYMPYQGKFIWGVTAAIINLLCCHLNNSANVFNG
ncbi:MULTISPECIES: CoA pyrophosphatase [unclassified Shewanella]|uniref:CoA pyrophosphatase n=1 Tax=unclassified Shewanella TaxID=196818 RepID=UPI000C83E69A|nr:MULTISPECIES: CoA pyrophosphatase [unclassified Shewanella]MDO6620721.1 CoA pyrophosphatase [Shewanella sp. 6_MG-2023]MDO6640466.1 CoA pyrophosphatase [Shewanella sp. 5_MG-2023]MDO6777267.1 CoA pyrophosphatase [Shewanella sp. 3_MG-2023]PMG28557.1 coenzyme A pyrophosphatase [Shewanella sp. 10N.286.52.C2]PMG41825.1 coenzyme A pyrophosphatase [Shewanella sp. 10N.286.52.B9]